MGDSDNAVRKIQQRLIYLGYLSDNEDDGIFGAKTKAAITAFQLNNAIHGDANANGVATTMTQAVLFSNNALSVDKGRRLTSWTMISDPYAIKIGDSIFNDDGKYYLEFRFQNNNLLQPVVAMVMRWWTEDSNGKVLRFGDSDGTYQSWKSSSSYLIGPSDIETMTWPIPDDFPLDRASVLKWMIVEVVYANGEVYMNYDASISPNYAIAAYSTQFD